MHDKSQDSFREDRISVIELNSVWFGVNITKSREVVPIPGITPVPNTDDFVIGLFNLRGEIYTLVDVSTILGMESKTVNENDMVVLIDGKDLTLGILVDRIHGVRYLDDAQIKPAHGIVSKKMEQFVSGIISERSSEIYLLDVDQLFSSQAIRTYY